MDDTAAGAPAADVEQHHICFLFQKVLLRRLDDALGTFRHTAVRLEKRRQGRGEHEVSCVGTTMSARSVVCDS